MMKRAACAVLAALVLLSGCERNSRAVSDEVYPAEKLFDYFFLDDMPWDETKEFSVSEFPDAKFGWNSGHVVELTGGGEKGLYWGMPVWGVYLADLNGDGKRELCSSVSMGSGIIDERIFAYDYVNGKLYELQERFRYDFKLELRDGVLVYVRTPVAAEDEELTEPLTIDKMTEIEKAQI